MALQGYKTRIIKVTWIDNKQHEEQFKLIQSYLKGQVECWDKNNKGKWFRARDLIGGDNKNWYDTPLQILYDYHYNRNRDDKYAYKQAAIDAGKILKKTLSQSKRAYDTKIDGNQVRNYRRVQLSN